MKNTKILTLGCLLVLYALVLLGCSTNITELDRMSVMELRIMALKYKRALLAQSEVLGAIIKWEFYQIKTPFTAEEAVTMMTKALEYEIDGRTVDWGTFELLRKKIKQKGGDLSGLELELEDLIRFEEPILPPLQPEELPPQILPPLQPEELPPELESKETKLT